MPPPRAIVIPFGVPAAARGLGLGLAGLVHSFARLEGQGIGLVQLHGRKSEEGAGQRERSAADREPSDVPAGPLEAFVPPSAWKDLAGAGHAPPEVTLVLTGAFEPPTEGRGLIQLLAYDAKDGGTRARVEAHVDVHRAGDSVANAFDELWSALGGGDIGVLRDIADLAWEPLESVLLAERCALFDPMKGEPYDRLAAMMHLGRAVEEAPDARLPAGRLAAIALDTAMGGADVRLTEAARRALTRAIEDAPQRVELVEATAALELRTGDAAAAEERLARAARDERMAERTRIYALLSEARRARRDLDGALDAVHAGLARAPDDPTLLTERGAVLLDRGDPIAAEADWRRAMELSPLYPSAFANLAALARKRGDAAGGEQLVDRALLGEGAHPEVLRQAIHVSIAMEPDGLPRAARLARLARALVERVPQDPWGYFVLARAEAQQGERDLAAEHLALVERVAPGSALAAEAQRGRFTLRNPQGAQEVESLLRAAYSVPSEELEGLAARGRRLAQEHPVWPAHFALGVVERRRERWHAARTAFEDAVGAAAGCTPAHLELVAVAVALKDADAAIRHATRAVALEGETPRTLAVYATALFSAGKRDEAETVIARARAMDPEDEATRALAERLARGSTPPPGPIARIKDTLARWLK